MNTNEHGIKVDEFGLVDTAYYVRQGQLARNEYFAQQLTALGNWLKKLTTKRQKQGFNSTRSFGTV
ncbi:RSP_7527 family protein [Amphritea sp.]|uniref:RSP_7527 family protein n=1 Tax=Amphritea sp. TaxID=1872502 RepID=UPI003567CE02